MINEVAVLLAAFRHAIERLHDCLRAGDVEGAAVADATTRLLMRHRYAEQLADDPRWCDLLGRRVELGAKLQVLRHDRITSVVAERFAVSYLANARMRIAREAIR